jgi:hypothetical protein
MTAILRGLRKAQGYACIVEEFGTREADTFTCNHCQKVVAVKAGASPTDLGGYCGGCSKMICPKCVGKACLPFEKLFERLERDYERRRSYGLTA